MDPKDRIEALIKTKASAMQEKMDGHDQPPGAKYRLDQAQMEAIIQNWPAAPKKIAEETVRRYGPPNEATPTLLIWHNNGPWKGTEITSDETPHNFPTPHTDYITQKIDYRVPLEKLAELGAFDGSLIVYRTAGLEHRRDQKSWDHGLFEFL
jgi:anaerobic selenocysteine-containing dehydrogenase